MCRSAQKGIYLKELIAEVRAGWAKRKVRRNSRAGQTGAVTELGFYHLSQGIPFLSRTPIVRFGSEAEVKHPTSG